MVTDPVLVQGIADGVACAPGAETYVPSDPATGLPRPNWESTVVESANVLRYAPAAIFVENLGLFSGGRTALARANRDTLHGMLTAYMLECAGIGAAVQNLWLAGVALGLKAAFLGDVGVDEQSIARRLGLRGDLVGVLALGYSNLEPEPKRTVPDDEGGRVCWHTGACPPSP